MKIAAVKNAKKHLVAVCFEDGGEVYLDKDILLSNPLKSGDCIDKETLDKLLVKSEDARAYSRALWYLDNSALSCRALFDKLIKAGFGEDSSKRAIERLKELGLLDDRRYAEHLAERLFEQNRSKREIYYKLTQRGIDRAVANEALSDLPEDEGGQIAALIEKKYKSDLAKENGKQKVFASLARKGFSYEKIKQVLKKYDIEEEF